MKNTTLRILISAILFSLTAGIVVSITGLVLGWKTPIQFSDAFFWVGAIIMSLGFLSVMGRLNQPILPYSQAGLHSEAVERTRQWAADLSQGYNIAAFLGVSGLLLFGLSELACLVGG